MVTTPSLRDRGLLQAGERTGWQCPDSLVRCVVCWLILLSCLMHAPLAAAAQNELEKAVMSSDDESGEDDSSEDDSSEDDSSNERSGEGTGSLGEGGSNDKIPPIPEVPQIPAMTILPSAPIVMSPPAEISLSGFAAFDWYQYFTAVGDLAPAGVSAVSSVAMVRLAPKLRARYRMLRARAEVEFRHDFVDEGRGGRVILREAVIGLQTHGFRFEGGALNYRWGKMDVASPTDNVVAQDFEELLDPEPLPVPGLRGVFAKGPFSVEVVFIPAFVPSRFRHQAPSRWDNTWSLPRTESVPGPFGGELIFTNHYDTFADAVVVDAEDNIAATFEAGVRVDLFLPSVDLGFSFLATHDRLPTYTAFQVANTAPTIPDGPAEYLETLDVSLDITPYHDRLLVPAFDFAVNVWRFVIKGEAAYFHTTDPEHIDCLVDDPYVRYALGAELVLPDLLGPVDLSLRLQYNGDVEIPKDGDDSPNQNRGCKVFIVADPDGVSSLTDRESGFQATPEIRHPYSHAWYFNINFGFTPQLSLDVRGFADLSGDALLKARLAWLVLDRLELSVGALAMLSTGDDTIFTPYGRNHRIEVGMIYRF